jgi:hypothetical protein
MGLLQYDCTAAQQVELGLLAVESKHSGLPHGDAVGGAANVHVPLLFNWQLK